MAGEKPKESANSLPAQISTKAFILFFCIQMCATITSFVLSFFIVHYFTLSNHFIQQQLYEMGTITEQTNIQEKRLELLNEENLPFESSTVHILFFGMRNGVNLFSMEERIFDFLQTEENHIKVYGIEPNTRFHKIFESDLKKKNFPDNFEYQSFVSLEELLKGNDDVDGSMDHIICSFSLNCETPEHMKNFLFPTFSRLLNPSSGSLHLLENISSKKETSITYFLQTSLWNKIWTKGINGCGMWNIDEILNEFLLQQQQQQKEYSSSTLNDDDERCSSSLMIIDQWEIINLNHFLPIKEPHFMAKLTKRAEEEPLE